jgi:hypothetical protein
MATWEGGLNDSSGELNMRSLYYHSKGITTSKIKSCCDKCTVTHKILQVVKQAITRTGSYAENIPAQLHALAARLEATAEKSHHS